MDFLFILILFASLAAITRTITTVTHEMGHALAGLVLFKGPISVYVGSYGDPGKGIHVTIGRLKAHFRYNLLLWHYGLCVSRSMDKSLIRSYMFVLAGPLASLFIAIGCLSLLISADTHGSIKMICLFLLISSVIDFFQNILPNDQPILLHNGNVAYNDGQSLKLLKSYKGVYSELLQLSEMYFNRDIEAGASLFESVYTRNKHPELMRSGIKLHLQSRHLSRVFELLEELGASEEMTSDDYCDYGLAYSYSNNHAKAIEMYTISLHRNPKNIYSLSNRAYSKNLDEKYDDAIADSDNAIELHPNFSHAYSNRGLSKIKLGKLEEGLEDIQHSLELDSNCSYAYMHKGIYYLEIEDIKTALSCFHRAHELDPSTHGLEDLIQNSDGSI